MRSFRRLVIRLVAAAPVAAGAQCSTQVSSCRSAGAPSSILGLLGSQWYTDHSTVPRDSLMAQLTIDMIGRGGPGEEPGGGPNYLQRIGPRRLSTEPGNLVEQVNSEGKFYWKFDY